MNLKYIWIVQKAMNYVNWKIGINDNVINIFFISSLFDISWNKFMELSYCSFKSLNINIVYSGLFAWLNIDIIGDTSNLQVTRSKFNNTINELLQLNLTNYNYKSLTKFYNLQFINH